MVVLSIKLLMQRKRKDERIPLPLEIAELVKRAGVKIKEIVVVKANNAHAFKNTLFLGKELIGKLSRERLLAIVKLVGKERIKSALLKILNTDELKEPSETHPSLADRLKYIDKTNSNF